MARLQSRGTTPLRPSPPDGSDSAPRVGGGGGGDTIGRQSPVKAPSNSSSSTTEGHLGFWGSRLNSSGGSVGSSRESGVNNIQAGGSSLSISSTGVGGSGGGSGNVPQRTSSFHGVNQSRCGSISHGNNLKSGLIMSCTHLLEGVGSPS